MLASLKIRRFHKNRIFANQNVDTKAKILTISSGKGGVGKTCTSVNLAILLAKQGYKVCLFDADANLANVNIMLKLVPEYTLHHVISGQKTLDDITLTKAGIQIIPGASGLTDFVSLTADQQQRLLATMRELKTKYDYLLIDNPAGINENVLSYINYSDFGIIVISPEPTSLTDAFALVRVLQKRGNQKILNIIVNNAPHETYAAKIFKRFSEAVKKHIGSQLNYLGCVLADEKIARSVSVQNPVVLEFPNAPSVRNYNKLCIKLTSLQKQHLTEKPKTSIEKETQQKSTPQQAPKQQHPDFSVNAVTYNNEIAIQKQAVEALTTEKLTTNFIDKINDEKIEQASLKEAVQQINTTYLKRFNNYAVDIPQILHDAMKMNRISKTTLENLIKTLDGLYQDQYGEALEIKTKEVKPVAKENNLKQETAELLIQLLQQDNPLELDSAEQENNSTAITKGPQLVPAIASPQNPHQDLIDSIRYAAMVDK